MIDCLALPSFHDGSGSAVWATLEFKAAMQTNATPRSLLVVVLITRMFLFEKLCDMIGAE
jgi:hypothetical protein